jgi:ribonuclease D
MISHPELLSTSKQIEALCQSLRRSKVIAFDTEFIRESTFYPIIELIQVATADESWLVDAQAFKRGFAPGPKGSFDPGIQPLLDVFEDSSILKIVHAAQGDEECLYTSFGSLAAPIFDTAVAASLCGYGDGAGLGKLLKSVLGIEIMKGHARTNWSVRPLPEQLLEYALADVAHLVALGQKLMEELDEIGRKSWAIDLSSKWSEKSLYETDSEALALRLARGSKLDRKSASVIVQLVRWREDRVRQLNVPRRWVADDAVLVDLARVRPKDLAHLSSFRGLNKGELKHSGEAILKAIHTPIETELPPSPKTGRPDIPNTEESQVLDVLKCYVGILADQHKIAAKHLMTTAQLLPLLRGKFNEPKDLATAGILSPEAATLVGGELIALLKGERALSIDGYRVNIVNVAK